MAELSTWEGFKKRTDAEATKEQIIAERDAHIQARIELERQRDALLETLKELVGGDGVYYIPESYVGASAEDWETVIYLDSNRRIVKRVANVEASDA